MTVTDPGTDSATDSSVDIETLAADVDEAIRAVAELDDDARATAERLQQAIEAFHRPGLVAIVRGLRADPRGKELLFELVDDPAVRAMLTLQGIIQPDGPKPASNGNGNGASAKEPTAPNEVFIPLGSVGVRRRGPEWVEGPLAADVPAGGMVRFDLGDEKQSSFVVTNVDGGITAFRNACIHQGLSLDGGMMSDGVLTCPWHGFTFDAATGECISAPGAQLEQRPTKVEAGRVWIRADD